MNAANEIQTEMILQKEISHDPAENSAGIDEDAGIAAGADVAGAITGTTAGGRLPVVSSSSRNLNSPERLDRQGAPAPQPPPPKRLRRYYSRADSARR